MTIRIRIHTDAVTVHCTPSWWDRLLGRGESDYVAMPVPSVSGGTIWVSDTTGRRVSARVAAAIDLARGA